MKELVKLNNMELKERFLKYVSFDTQSDPESETYPSTAKQLILLHHLAEEMEAMGLTEVEVDANGYAMGTIPATPGCEDRPVIGFISHVDTSPDMGGANIKPQVIENYDGKDIRLNEQLTMRVADFPELSFFKGHTLITTDGTTLLGADDKAGVAEIMTAAEYVMQHPELKHGKIRLGFTPDEEVGRGVDFFDVKGWGADVAYTIDGGAWGEMEYETFNAASMKVRIQGQNIHPGSAKGKMKNALLVGMEFESMLPAGEKPQFTEGYEGYFHLNNMSGSVESALLDYLIRDHSMEIFEKRKAYAMKVGDFLNEKYGAGTVEVEINDMYYNMAEKIRPHMYLMDIAAAAFKELGVDAPVVRPVRGGTDGSRLSYMGVPCPNLCAGGHNAHGKYEFVCIQSMENIVQLLIKIAEKFKDVKKNA